MYLNRVDKIEFKRKSRRLLDRDIIKCLMFSKQKALWRLKRK